MYHSITFGDKNTWDDWHLIPSTRPVFAPPKVKTYTVDIPGADGVLDLTEALSNRPLFQNRTGSLEFICDPEFMNWSALYSTIMEALHGRVLRAVLEDDPSYYYEGRFTVNEWRSGKNYSTIVIDYNVNPYKKEVHDSTSDWLWDTFNFETGIVRDYRDIFVDGSVTQIITGTPAPNTPVFLVTGTLSVSFKGKAYDLSEGENTIRAITIENGRNELTFTGNGTVTIRYNGGCL